MLAGIPWDASIAGLKPGDELTYEDLLYASLLPSGADATMSLAHLVSGSVDKFVELMNSKAKQIGLTNTNFVNVTGYDAEGQSSSLKDVFILLKYSLKNDIFKKVYTASSHQMKNGKIVNRTVDMYNKLYNFDLSAIKGSKTGYTNKAGMCMSALLELHDREFIIITLGAEVKPKTAYNLVDTISIIDSITNTFENHIFYDENSLLLNIPVKNSHETSYSVKLSKPIYKFLEISNDIGECTYKYVGKKYLSFKDKEGSTIGKIEYYYDGELIDEDLIILSETLTKSAIKYYGPKIIVFLLILLIILCLYKISRRKKRRRQKKLY
ncbi:MAG TPA: hypothetical protein DCY94_03695 [Firmicutes bacterium]|nr:hypothetical protein [Bacillota bacterium]